MENIHGVDVSWLHRPTNDHNALNTPPPSNPTSPPQEPVSSPATPAPAPEAKKPAEDTKTNGARAVVEEVAPQPSLAQPIPKQTTGKRPGLLSRSPSEKSASSAPTGRKQSWMSSLSSKLTSQKSSSTSKNPPPQSAAPSQPASSSIDTPAPHPNVPISDRDASRRRSYETQQAIEEEDTTPHASTSPKPTGSFFSSALRRLSNSSVTAPFVPDSSQPAQVPQVERKVMNVDQGRDRLPIKGLNQAKLRRVSFSVDVEIAGCSRYISDDDSPEEVAERKAKIDKKKDKKLKERSEGEALKHPDAVRESVEADKKKDRDFNERSGGKAVKQLETARKRKDEDDVIRINGRIVDDFPSPYGMVPGRRKSAVDNSQYTGATPQKIEKKKIYSKSHDTSPEEAKKAALEASRTRAISDVPKPKTTEPQPVSPPVNAVPPEAAPTLTPPTDKPSQDKPTTDPLRIYRRCCQLREAPVLKRISEQLGSPTNCGVEAPGVVTCLNLNRSRMQLTDIVCLGDFLAVVPVKKLLIDDANLTDEGVRIILAGLLAARLPELYKRKRGRSSPTRLRDNSIHRTPGVVEKLTFKGNKKLTAEAWRHICIFLNLCKSIKAVDFSMVPFPAYQSTSAESDQDVPQDIADLLSTSLSTRLGGDVLAELTFADCGLDDYQISKIVDGASKMQLRRLGLAGNRVSVEGFKHIASYIKSGNCKGIDLAGLNVHKNLSTILGSLTEELPLQFVSFANTNLDASELKPLFEKLVLLSDLRFLDLSHNKKLFSPGQQVNALTVLRTYLPKMKMVKRIHLMDVNMTTADAIGIAEIVPEIRNLAHLNILENPQLAAVASATDAASSEEACALYASLMTAVRLSKTMVCVDINVPNKDSSEVVRALARQVIAYCLRNLEIFANGDALRVADAAAHLPDVSDADTDMLADIVGRSESGADTMSLPASAKNEDYLVGGQGWVKALNHCLNAADMRRLPSDGSGSRTPTQILESEGGKVQAKEMSKDLLLSARNFRQRLQSVLAREEAGTADDDVMKRLTFLDSTIKSIIERFEDEYPECRLTQPSPPMACLSDGGEDEPVDPSSILPPAGDAVIPGPYEPDTPAPSTPTQDRAFSRRGSATDLASFALATEEAKFHRLTQKFRRDVLPPHGLEDKLHGTRADDPVEPEHDLEMRRRMEALDTEALRNKVNSVGWEATLSDFKEERERLMRQALGGESSK